MSSAYNKTTEEVLKDFQSDSQLGLSAYDAELRLSKYGLNALPQEKSTSLFILVLNQFQDKLTLILLASAVISFGLAFTEGELSLHSFVDPVVILTILILNAIVGVQQESSAESALAALNDYTSKDVRVLRDGKFIHVKQDFLAPGDIINLTVGDIVPADARILEIKSQVLKIDQSILTGESESVIKDVQPINIQDAVKQEQTNIIFSGTTIVAGRCHAVVILTGEQTAIGSIFNDIVSQISQPTPLKEKLDEFGDSLASVITVICILVWAINYKNFDDPVHGGYLQGVIYYFKIAVALAVAAIPEGLSVVITTCLALGTKKMAKQNAIVRNLASVETLGSTDIICSDKTGTLTTNQMVVSNLVYFDDQELNQLKVTGHSFNPKGDVINACNGKIINLPDSKYPILHRVAQICSICNDASIVQTDADSFKNIGEPTESALKVFVEKLAENPNPEYSITPISDLYNEEYQKLATFEFTRDRKSMSVVINNDSNVELLVKGAPESILNRSISYLTQVGESLQVEQLTEEKQSELLQSIESYESKGLRVIALAYRDQSLSSDDILLAKSSDDYLQLEQDLTFVGFTTLIDPPRPEVAQSIKECHQAGIKVVIITGDSPRTAENIAKQIGIFEEDTNDNSEYILTGREFQSLSDEEKLEAVQKVKLFARVEPSHKSELVSLFQSQGHIVAMTGDGVNDAPALKKADIGISMGSGTDVARFASDLVLQDDNFTTIVSAVKEGRLIYNNTRQFIRYLISSNIGEVVSIFVTAALGLPEALAPVQLLWVNLVTDGLPASALGFNPPDLKIMKTKPKKKSEPLVSMWLLFRYLVVGTYVGLGTVFGYVWYFLLYSQGPQVTFEQLSTFHSCDPLQLDCSIFSNQSLDTITGSTISLSILVIIEMFNAMNNLSESDSLLTFPLWKNVYLILAIILSIVLHLGILYVPALNVLFGVVPLNLEQWGAIIAISAPVIVIDELFKLFERFFFIRERD